MNFNSHSTYWLGNDMFKKISDASPEDLLKYQRSIGKFVRILTKKSIPVAFKSDDGMSYTDGKSVVISSDITQKNFDSIVGLALHEGSHILLTDFNFLKSFERNAESLLRKEMNMNYTEATEAVLLMHQRFDVFKSLLNYVEDRRIDYYVYTNSPGYKPYYEAMYDRFFNRADITQAMKEGKFSSPTLKNYMVNIINFLNENSDLDVLPDLDKMYNLIFDSVPTLESLDDSFIVTYKVWELILKNLIEQESEENDEYDNSEESDENGDTEPSDSDSNGSGDESDSSNDESDDGSSDGESDENESDDGSSDSDSDDDSEDGDSEDKGSDSNLIGDDSDDSEFAEAVQSQTDFLNGDVEKQRLDSTTKNMVDKLNDMDITTNSVPYEDSYGNTSNIDVHTIRGFSQTALGVVVGYETNNSEAVREGLRLGKRLGRKLHIRNSERTTTFNRKRKGRLDKRRIHTIGFGEEQIFNQFVTESHTDAFIHISIDASGSMSGKKFTNSIVSAVAVAKMAEITNIDVEIAFRYTAGNFGASGRSSNHGTAYNWIVYDSRVNSMKDIHNIGKLDYTGLTPEGICFAGLVEGNELPIGSDNLKTYFINYSDGMPGMSGGAYGGQPAVEHTKKQVDKISQLGYTVISFFIGNGEIDESSSTAEAFKRMYGKNSSFINPTELGMLAKELRKMFI